MSIFTPRAAEYSVKGGAIGLTQATRYPWDGRIRIAVAPAQAEEFTLNLRIPGWAADRPVKSDLYVFADAKSGGPEAPASRSTAAHSSNRPSKTATGPSAGSGRKATSSRWISDADPPRPANAAVEADAGAWP